MGAPCFLLNFINNLHYRALKSAIIIEIDSIDGAYGFVMKEG